MTLADIPWKEYHVLVGRVYRCIRCLVGGETLRAGEQDDVAAIVAVLEEKGPQLPFPYCLAVAGSRHRHMRELRVQSGGDPLRVFRVFYAFDPRRTAILLIGGNKAGESRFYARMIALADRLYDEYLAELRREGLIAKD